MRCSLDADQLSGLTREFVRRVIFAKLENAALVANVTPSSHWWTGSWQYCAADGFTHWTGENHQAAVTAEKRVVDDGHGTITLTITMPWQVINLGEFDCAATAATASSDEP